MATLELILCILLLIIGVVLIVTVLMQQGKSKGLSGTIAGGADTFFGKTKGKSKDAVLSKVTAILSVAFAVIVLLVYIISDKPSNGNQQTTTETPATETAGSLTTEEAQTSPSDTAETQSQTEEAPETSGEASTEEAPETSGEASTAEAQTAE